MTPSPSPLANAGAPAPRSSAARPSFIVVTGDSDGLGHAVTRALLRTGPDLQVIGLSRRADAQVAGLAELPESERARYRRIRVDLAQPREVDRAVAEVLSRVRLAGGRIRSLLLVNGTGFLDTQLHEQPERRALMGQLNLHAPVALVRGLSSAGDVFGPRAQVLYYSGLVTHPSVTDPLLREHAELKKQAVQALSALRSGRVTSVMPGAYMTPMLQGVITRCDSLLEWYAVPICDPHARGGLADAVAKLAVQDNDTLPETLIRPRISRLLVEKQSADQLAGSLPGAIVRCARAVLRQTGQTDEDHDRRVRYLKARRLYGDDFPYDAILSERLWPAWLSCAYAWLLGAFALTR